MEIVIIAQEITRKESVCFLGSVPMEIIGKDNNSHKLFCKDAKCFTTFSIKIMAVDTESSSDTECTSTESFKTKKDGETLLQVMKIPSPPLVELWRS